MLKSLSTQFVAALLFGPLGLAYSSMAAAVFLTLLLAVLYFSELGVLAFVVIWPIAIVTGLVFVKFHNDGIQQSGSRLLLGPGESPDLVTTIGSWVRAVSVLTLIAIAGFIGYLYLPAGSGGNSNGLGRIVDAGRQIVDSNNGLGQIADATPGSDSSTALAGEQNTGLIAPDDGFAVIALPRDDVASVIVDSGESATRSNTAVASQGVVYVREAVVNLRQGPGVSFPILTQVERGDKLIEFARDGQWVNVETENSQISGWIYGRLVSPNVDP